MCEAYDLVDRYNGNGTQNVAAAETAVSAAEVIETVARTAERTAGGCTETANELNAAFADCCKHTRKAAARKAAAAGEDGNGLADVTA